MAAELCARPTGTTSRSSPPASHCTRRRKAANSLAEEGINARVIDLYSVKPIDTATLHAAAEATQGRIVTVEDHRPEGGIGEAVLAAFADADERTHVSILAVRDLPTSGKPAGLLAAADIDAEHIVQAVRALSPALRPEPSMASEQEAKR